MIDFCLGIYFGGCIVSLMVCLTAHAAGEGGTPLQDMAFVFLWPVTVVTTAIALALGE